MGGFFAPEPPEPDVDAPPVAELPGAAVPAPEFGAQPVEARIKQQLNATAPRVAFAELSLSPAAFG